jgi:hypothetical protein
MAFRLPTLEYPPDLLCSGTDGKEEDLRTLSKVDRFALAQRTANLAF